MSKKRNFFESNKGNQAQAQQQVNVDFKDMKLMQLVETPSYKVDPSKVTTDEHLAKVVQLLLVSLPPINKEAVEQFGLQDLVVEGPKQQQVVPLNFNIEEGQQQ